MSRQQERITANGVTVEQEILSQKSVGVPLIIGGILNRYRVMRIRRLGLKQIAAIEQYGSSRELTEAQKQKIQDRKKRLGG